MSGGTFATNGRTAAAPTTIWMSKIADQFTMLCAFSESTGLITTTTSQPACKYANIFNAANLSFGAFTTAPDGTTNTAQKLVEDGTSNIHYIQAGFQAMDGMWPTFRVAGIWKAAERTRIAYVVPTFGGTGAGYIYCGFDLSGGQIAYGQTFSGNGSQFWKLTNQVIAPVGNGFYLCIGDFLALQFQAGNQPHGCDFHFALDNASGTQSPSITYTGNSASGLYGWRNSVLPVDAWDIHTTTFFDDFNDLSTIDVNNTMTPGFNWYVEQYFWDLAANQGWYIANPIAPGSLSVSSSVLRIPALSTSGSPGIAMGIGSFGANAAQVSQGKGWTLPAVFEAKLAYGYSAAWNSGDFSFWGGFKEWAQTVVSHIPAGNRTINGGEFDFCETQGSGFFEPTAGAFFYIPLIGIVGFDGIHTQNVNLGFLKGAQIGYPIFQSTFVANSFYSQGQTISHNGIIYYENNPGATTSTPPSADWTVYDYAGAPTANNTPHDPLITVDFTAQNVWTTILLPYNRQTKDRGCRLQFFNGVFRGSETCWTPYAGNFSTPIVNDASTPYQHSVDWQQFLINLGQSGGTTGTGYDFFVDYVKVMQ